eukprot:TRINITY_DN3806_c0_g1_i1.p1 TRINITY_DN3806_c0_g1~~TRINITY_DN3806_c0_g1_i1.p1  ORF type:complete len:955 (+),score=131.27 TRINITY_DN3806_c0_g1_i1:107-2971(+)
MEPLLDAARCEEIIAALEAIQGLDVLERVRDDVVSVCASVVALQGLPGKALQGRLVALPKTLKERLSPVNRSTELKALAEAYSQSSPQDRTELGRTFLAGVRALTDSDEGRRFTRAMNDLEAEVAKVARLGAGAGRSNRAKRAKAASSVFTRYAGLMKPEDMAKLSGSSVATDKYGNADGTQYDLGQDGAFDGLVVVILQLYTFNIRPPVEALERKGFKVVLFPRAPGVSALREVVQTASQVWVISNCSKVLSEEEMDFLVEQWKDGLSLYVWGDNDPYYVDANRLLAKIFPGEGVSMTGNHPGQQAVQACPPGGHIGFAPHLLTTGLTSLHEGNTIASLDPKVMGMLDFEPVLYDHEGNLIVVVRKAQKGSGSIIIDGAFTKLYCQWEGVAAGSARFVRNCACFLSAVTEEVPQVRPEKAQGEELEGPRLNWANCFLGSCDISMEERQPLAILGSRSPASEDNTSDFVLDNALGAGLANVGAFGKQAYAFEVAKLFLGSGKDPFRRVEVEAVIPCVSLAFEENRTLVGDLLCTLLLQGIQIPQKAFFIFLSVCDRNLLNEDCERADVWTFFESQIVQNLLGTATFTDIGPKIRLLDAMQAFLLDEGCLNKTFAFLAVVVRVLLRQKAPLDEKAVRLSLKRSALRVLLVALLGQAKKERGCSLVRDRIEGLLYQRLRGILPVRGSAREVVCLEGYRSFVASSEALLADMARTSQALPSALAQPLIHDKEMTATLLLLLGLEDKNLIVSVKALLETLCKSAQFASIWNNASPDPAVLQWDCLSATEKQLGVFSECDKVHREVSPFLTCFGPSVFRCICGVEFGKPAEVNLDEPAQVEALKLCRNRHFQEVYQSDANGYPTATSAHCSLHRAVQRVVSSEVHVKAVERTEEMENDVLHYLRKHSKGDFYYQGIIEHIQFLVDSYLGLRRKGLLEPKHNEPIDFAKRAKHEQALHLK